MTQVRTKLRPTEVIEVGDAELIDLERQGLIHSRKLDKDEKQHKGEAEWVPAKASTRVETTSGVITDAPTGEASK